MNVMALDWLEGADAMDVSATEMVVATADAADVPAYERLRALLARVRHAFGIEAAFVSEWAEGSPVGREGDEAHALHTHYALRLIEKTAPVRGRVAVVPVRNASGVAVGTLCTRSHDADAESALRSVARLIAGCFSEPELAAVSA